MRISDWSSDVCSSDLAAENSATGDAAISEEPLRPLGEAALPPLPPAKPADRRPVVVIDPGHGGVDPGAIGVSGISEKNLTLRSEERRVGKEGVSQCRSRWSHDP